MFVNVICNGERRNKNAVKPLSLSPPMRADSVFYSNLVKSHSRDGPTDGPLFSLAKVYGIHE